MGDLLADLDRWLSEARTDAAAAARSRERWLRQQAAEEATFAGVLLDLAERRQVVVVDGRGGRRHRGMVRAVAQDFFALATDVGDDVLLRYTGVAAVRPRGDGSVTGDRPQALDLDLGEALLAVAGDRPRILVVTADGTRWSGTLRWAGGDVVALRLDGAEQATAYVALAAVVEVTLNSR